jgi:hypothetical protein
MAGPIGACPRDTEPVRRTAQGGAAGGMNAGGGTRRADNPSGESTERIMRRCIGRGRLRPMPQLCGAGVASPCLFRFAATFRAMCLTRVSCHDARPPV